MRSSRSSRVRADAAGWHSACPLGRPVHLLLAGAAALLLAACGGPASTLDPAGPRAARAAELWWAMTAMAAVVYALVLALLLYALVRRRRGPGMRLGESGLIVAGGIVLPLIVLPVIWVMSIGTMREEAAPPSEPAATIEVIGHMWWYEVRYPGTDRVLENELRLPVGRPVLLRLTSADVIHSFWAPRLAGKMDLIPGRINELWIQADEPGEYPVLCAEFCGLEHANMHMRVIAEPPERFAAWLQGD